MQYFVVMIDYGRRGREAVVDPEITRREVVSRIVSGEYRNICFIHEIAGSLVEDVTADILAEAALPEADSPGAADSGAWMPVVAFLPDGTARDDATVTLVARGCRPVILRIRGLTGVITVKTPEASRP